MKSKLRFIVVFFYIIIIHININALSYVVPETFKVGEHEYYLSGNIAVLVRAGYSINGEVDIPETIFYDGLEYKVGGIASHAFSGTNVQSIEIPNSVWFISNGAFAGCKSLKTIFIPESVTNISFNSVNDSYHPWIEVKGLFYGCDSLLSIVVDKNNKYYDSRNGCNAIIQTRTGRLMTGCRNTVIPSSVKSIHKNAFRGCTGLERITIPGSVQTIGSYAFAGCTSLSNIEIPSSVQGMGKGVF